jgi:hypothetical protein
MMERRINGFGINFSVPPGWDARIFQRVAPEPQAVVNPVAHIGNFALPVDAGDFGNGAYTIMGANGIFMSLVEFDQAHAQEPLFSTHGIPSVDESCFDPFAMPIVVPGMAGRQFFFNIANRAFCAFLVVGSYAQRAVQAPQLHAVLATLQVATR